MDTPAINSIHWSGRPMAFEAGAPENTASFPTALDAAQKAANGDVTLIRQLAAQMLASTQQQMMSALSGSEAGAPPTQYQWLGLMALAANLRRERTEEARRTPTTYRPGSKFDEVIGFAARRFDLPERLIHAVIRAESNYNPQAVSPVGARGLMQLMPGTADALGVNDSMDPIQNIMGGARYLRQMLDRFGGDLRKTLAAYNWGPGNVEGRGMERMPEETRNYVAYIARLLDAPEGPATPGEAIRRLDRPDNDSI